MHLKASVRVVKRENTVIIFIGVVLLCFLRLLCYQKEKDTGNEVFIYTVILRGCLHEISFRRNEIFPSQRLLNLLYHFTWYSLCSCFQTRENKDLIKPIQHFIQYNKNTMKCWRSVQQNAKIAKKGKIMLDEEKSCWMEI